MAKPERYGALPVDRDLPIGWCRRLENIDRSTVERGYKLRRRVKADRRSLQTRLHPRHNAVERPITGLVAHMHGDDRLVVREHTPALGTDDTQALSAGEGHGILVD